MDLTKLKLDALWTFYDVCTANQLLRTRIDAELKNRIPPPNKYSLEYLYSVNIIGKKALIIFFKPGTKAFENYGRRVVINLVLSEETAEKLAKNYAAKPAIRTQGNIKGESLVIEGITDEQRKRLKTVGFETEDVMFVEWE